MEILKNLRFEEKDLIGLDYLHFLLEYVYGKQEVVEAIYEQKIYSLSRCRDLSAAQRMLDFEIELACYYAEQLYLIRDLETKDDAVFNATDELESILFLENIMQTWRAHLQ